MDAVSSGIDLSKEPKFSRAFRPALLRPGLLPQGDRAVHDDRPAGRQRRRRHRGRGQPKVRLGRGLADQDRRRQRASPTWSTPTGTLIAHPDISLVLKKTDLSALPQVAALARPSGGPRAARDLKGDEVLPRTRHPDAGLERVRRVAARRGVRAAVRDAAADCAGAGRGAADVDPRASSWRARWCGRCARCSTAPSRSAPATSNGTSRCDRRRARRPGRAVQPDERAAARVVCRARAQGRAAHRPSSPRRSSTRPRRPRSSRSSAVRRPTSRRSSMPSPSARRALPGQRQPVWLLAGDRLRAATGYKRADGGEEAGRSAGVTHTSVIGRAFATAAASTSSTSCRCSTANTQGPRDAAAARLSHRLGAPMLARASGRRHRHRPQRAARRSCPAKSGWSRPLPTRRRSRSECAPRQRDQGGAAQGRGTHLRAERGARLPDGDQQRAARHQPVAERRRPVFDAIPRARRACSAPDRRRVSATTATGSTSRRPTTGRRRRSRTLAASIPGRRVPRC